MIKIYNTLTKKKELIEKNTSLKIYTCGVTVYDYCHIGHARIFLLFDSLIRYFNSINFKITLIRNITDVDDKIIKRAKKKNTTTLKLTRYFTKAMRKDSKNLNLIEPTYEPKATTFIPEMINLIEKLKKKKYTYKNNKSDIYFNVNKFESYGQLSKQCTTKLKQSYKNSQKKHKIDFALWKQYKKTDTISWNTPWGEGRPGWHTECAAMIMYYSKNIDIHGGGHDLLFPHHENELAQCETLLQKKFIKIWMHIGQLKINKKKMSKTSNNYILIKDFLKKFNEEYLRFLILSTNYKKSINYNLDILKKVKKTLDKLYEIKNNLKKDTYIINEDIKTSFNLALNDNFNTQKAISILFKALHDKKINKDITNYTIITLLNSIGLLKYEKILQVKNKKLNINRINFLVQQRNLARKNKDWILADKIRSKLNAMNIQLTDRKDTTIFENL